MSGIKSKEIHLASRPNGMPTKDNFKLAEVEMRAIKDGEILIKNHWMSVDPYMRGRMMDMESYVPPFQIGEPLSGGAIGEVIESKNADYPVGTWLNHFNGWREYAISDGMLDQKIDPTLAPPQAFLGVLGMPGMTAYAGLLRIGELKEGDNVFVTAASGAVGGVVCQIAKAKGHYVAGSAGSDDKCKWLEDVAGIDKAINYKHHKTQPELEAAMRDACPNGIDVYFENVGGDHLTSALNLMNPFARAPLCGMISRYNDTTPTPGPWNLVMAVGKSLKLQGFIVSNHLDLANDFVRDMSGWIKDGKIKWEETVYEGVEKAPDAFLGLFSGANFGKMLVKLS
jgi:NADPH-dependent curcumin reductase CurA